MKKFLFLLFLSGYATNALTKEHYVERLMVGKSELRLRDEKLGDIAVAVELVGGTQYGCDHWRWGSEFDCPATSIASLKVSINGEQIFMPLSSFIDLGSPKSVLIEAMKKGFLISIKGGDAATSYIATLELVGGSLLTRRVVNAEFKDVASEITRYRFPQ